MRTALVLLLSLAAWPAQAQLEQINSLFSAGGIRMTGGNYELTATLGSPLDGVSASGTIELQQGLWTNPDGLVVGVGKPTTVVGSYLARPWPNPSRRGAVLEFGLTQPAQTVTISIYDVHGALVRTLRQGSFPTGVHRLTWNLRTNAGHAVANGLYFVRLDTQAFTQAQRVAVIR